MSKSQDKIIVKGARQHNLKNINLEIPKNKFVVFTGVSGSGKSSLAMDTIYAEGQRRYVESLSSYARQFLGVMDKPDVDSIEGLSPAIAIDQKTTSKNPRSTVGTVTEIYDYLRLLFARIGNPHCPECGTKIARQSPEQIADQIFKIITHDRDFDSVKGTRFLVLSPVVRDRKGEFSSLLDNLRKQGVMRVRIDGHVKDLNEEFDLIKTNKHTVEAILARMIINKKKLKDHSEEVLFRSELFQTIETALKISSGYIVLALVKDKNFDFPEKPTKFEDTLFSENFACPNCGASIPELEPRVFSFNSPHGACSKCDGIGTQLSVDEAQVYNPNLSVKEGGIFPWSNLFDGGSYWVSKVVESVASHYGFSLKVPINKLSPEHFDILLHGPKEEIKFRVEYEKEGQKNAHFAKFEGVVPNLIRRHKDTSSDYIRNEIEKYMVREQCSKCNGTRLNDTALSVVIGDKNIFQIASLPINKLSKWSKELQSTLGDRDTQIANPIMKEILFRIQFLIDVGLTYLNLSRTSSELSGGEAQRIRLASQIGSGLSGVLYVLDEPSIGLHQRDQGRLIKTLKNLRDLGNTVLVVEHDMETMLESDYIFDFGPGAGEHGGKVIAHGTPKDIIKDPNSITGKYLSGKKKVGHGLQKHLVGLDLEMRDVYKGEVLKIKGARGRNLKKINVEIPLGKFVCVTGVSGSGKSSLVMDTLHPAIRAYFGLKNEERPEVCDDITGLEHLDKIIAIDQAPIGRTPKSNPATYTKTFDHIRELFAKTEGSRIRGYKSGRFSFNVKGGRCEACAGEGQIKIEMQFMPDVYVNCDVCMGKRYNRETLEVTYKDKSISEVLDMTVEEALRFFDNIPIIRRKLQTITDVGLGYIRLGQPAPTLSGGEAQRVKLATELSKQTRGKAFYILDEPTTGLHFADLEKLISIIKRLTARGNTVLVIEHNMDVISNADWVIDLGPEGGEQGGNVVFEGPLSELLDNKLSYTAQSLHQHLAL
ncbi:excinuclease ABC subunit UvrA [candidate division WWE3 bacterium]|nr:excinuclease ABC subunit UvrA [candidate division WWE3 bacterium]